MARTHSQVQQRQIIPQARVVELLDEEFTDDENAELRREVHEVRATVEGWSQRGLER